MEPEIKTRPFFFGPCPHSHGLVVRMCVYLDLKTSEGRCKKRKVKLFKGFYFPFSPRSTPPLHFSAAKIEGFSPREDEDLGRGWRRGWFMQEGCYRSTVSCYAVQCVPCSYIKWSSSSSSLLCVASGKKMFPWLEQDRKVGKDHQWWNCVIGFFSSCLLSPVRSGFG